MICFISLMLGFASLLIVSDAFRSWRSRAAAARRQSAAKTPAAPATAKRQYMIVLRDEKEVWIYRFYGWQVGQFVEVLAAQVQRQELEYEAAMYAIHQAGQILDWADETINSLRSRFAARVTALAMLGGAEEQGQ